MKKGMVNLIVLALQIVILVLLIVVVFTFVPAVKKSNSLVQKVSDIVDLNIGNQSGANSGEVSLADQDIIEIKFADKTDTVASLKNDGTGMHYLKLSLSVSLNKNSEDYSEKSSYFNTSMSIIDSTILQIVSNYTATTVTQAALEKDILAALNRLFDSDDLVYKVSISQYVIQ